MPENVFCWL